MISNSIFDVSYYISNYQFLPFRNFQPFRSEAICLISVIFWKKQDKADDSGNFKIYNELINEFVKCGTIQLEIDNLRMGNSEVALTQSFNLRKSSQVQQNTRTIQAKSTLLKTKKMNQKNNVLRKMNAINFFSRLIRSGDKDVLFLLRKQFVLEALERVFQEDGDLKVLYKDTAELIKNLN